MTPKPKGGSDSQLTRLKQLAAASQEAIWAWRAEVPALTNAQIRHRIATQFGIRLGLDKQLSQFWSWYSAQQDLQATNELLETFEEFVRTQNPEWSEAQVRSVGIKFFLANSVATKNAEQFAQIVTLDQRERFGRTQASQKDRQLDQQERKLKLLEQKAAAFDAAKRVTASQLTAEQKAAEYRRIFGMS